jgi:hypothetical protein
MLVAGKQLKKFLTFMESNGSLPFSREPSMGPYTEPDESSTHFPIMFL